MDFHYKDKTIRNFFNESPILGQDSLYTETRAMLLLLLVIPPNYCNPFGRNWVLLHIDW